MLRVEAVDHLIQDVRYAKRILIRSRAFTAIAMLSLTLGIGANTAIFSLINAIILRSLPVRHPEQLFALNRTTRQGHTIITFAYPFYREANYRNDLFSGVVFERTIAPSLSLGDSTELVSGEAVSGNYFNVLGTIPYAGRLLRHSDETSPGADRVVVLSYAFWKTHFGSDRSIIGKTIHLNRTPMVIIGISPPEYHGLRAGVSTDIYVPITMWPLMLGDPALLPSQNKWFGFVLCRLKPGIRQGQAESALTALYRNYMRQFPHSSEKDRISLFPAATGLDSQARRASKQLYILMAVVGFVLLAACVNLANLLLARTVSRQHEIAVRLSLGASRFRIVRQLLTESILLAGIGGAFGLAFAYWAARLLSEFLIAGQFGASIDVSPDQRVFLFTLMASLTTGILFGLAPALRSTRLDIMRQLKGERPHLLGTRINLERILVGGQLALSLLLLVAAGLFLRSLKNLHDVSPGFDARHILEIEMDPILAGYGQDRVREFYREAHDRVSHLPGVISASFSSLPLMRNFHMFAGIRVQDYQPPQDDPGPEWNSVGAEYFKTLRIPIVRGREFGPQDTQNALRIAIVNETFARFYFGQQDPIGKLVGPARVPVDYQIIGVARDVKYASLREPTPRFWYVPYEQDFDTADDLTLYARTVGNPSNEITAIRQAIRGIDPNVPVFHPRTLEQQIENSIASDRMVALCSTFFSLLTALLAGIGLYGTVSCRVVARTQEIGIRMALGAEPSDVIWPVMVDVASTLAVGALAGVLGVIVLGRFVASMLFGVKPADPFTLLTASLFMAIVAFVAGYLPAWRAARIEPMVTLRYE